MLHIVLLLLHVLRVLRLLRLLRPMRLHLLQPLLRLLIQGGRSRPFLFRLLLLLPGVSSEGDFGDGGGLLKAAAGRPWPHLSP